MVRYTFKNKCLNNIFVSGLGKPVFEVFSSSKFVKWAKDRTMRKIIKPYNTWFELFEVIIIITTYY